MGLRCGKGPLAFFVLTLQCEACWQLGEIMLKGSDQRPRGGQRAQVKRGLANTQAECGRGQRLATGAPGVK